MLVLCCLVTTHPTGLTHPAVECCLSADVTLKAYNFKPIS